MTRPKGIPSERKGKTLEEIFGKERAIKIKLRMHKPRSNSDRIGRYVRTEEWRKIMGERRKGKTYEELYGEEEGNKKRLNQSKIQTQKHKEKVFGYKKGELLGDKNYARMPEVRKKISVKAVMLRCNMPKKETSIERKMKKILLENNILFIPQYNFYNKFAIDFALPQYNVAIEVDGEYWHNYPFGTEKDKLRDKYISACGWKIIRIWGKDTDNKEYCMEMIKNAIK